MPKGRPWPKGRSPWAIADMGETTFNTACRLDLLKGDFDTPRLRALREAYAGVGLAVPAKFMPPGSVPVEPVPRAPASVPAASIDRPAPTRSGPTARSATVGVSYRATVDQHDRLRDIAHTTRRPLQALLDEAVNDFLAKHG